MNFSLNSKEDEASQNLNEEKSTSSKTPDKKKRKKNH